MTKFSRVSTVLGLLAFAASAYASPHARLPAADTDGDGSVSFAEMQVAHPDITTEQFARLDANGDGVLDRGEGRRQGRKPRMGPDVDTNGDGNIDLTEIQAAHPGFPVERFSELDTNGDGVLSADERPARSRRGERFATLDTDGSGGVSLAEMQVQRSDMDQDKFASIDADGNGEISKDELRQRHRNRDGSKGGHGKKGQGYGGKPGGQIE